MQLFSTRNRSHIVELKEAVISGLAPDGGLYLPCEIPILPAKFIQDLHSFSELEMYLELSHFLFQDDLSKADITAIIEKVFQFEIPLKHIHNNTYSLELFHGPTLAFKDVGARFMANLMSYFRKNENQKLNIVVATSGDTGSAVASGFFEIEGIEVFILYPKNKVSPLQEKQITGWGKNITAIEVNGTFDDCQALVKKTLSDVELNKKLALSSANSINIARLLPQAFYYFSSFSKLQNQDKPLVYAVPSGNFGNLTAGLLAYKMGLPIRQFVAATNINDVVPQYLKTGNYQTRPSKSTISNAMDVGAPSNFERMQSLFPTLREMQNLIKGFHFTDYQTSETLNKVYKKYGYLLDPHGSVAYLGLQQYLNENSDYLGVFLETAHPAKFRETVEDIIGHKITLPERLAAFAERAKQAVTIENQYENLKNIIEKKN